MGFAFVSYVIKMSICSAFENPMIMLCRGQLQSSGVLHLPIHFWHHNIK